MSQGMMSAAIANVRTAQAAATAVTGLPARAAAVQSSMSTTIDTMLDHVGGACTTIVAAANSLSAPLDAADAAVDAGDGAALKSTLDQMQTQVAAVTDQMTAANSEVKVALEQIINDNHQLAAIGNDLAAEITRAQAEADEASREAEALDQKKWYLLALGPFGLVGLATCIALLVEAGNKVTKLRQQVSGLRGQAAQQTKVQTDLDLLRQEVPTVSNTLLSLQNGLSFIDSDTSAVVADVHKAPGSPIAKAFLLVARHQIQTLATDAS